MVRDLKFWSLLLSVTIHLFFFNLQGGMNSNFHPKQPLHEIKQMSFINQTLANPFLITPWEQRIKNFKEHEKIYFLKRVVKNQGFLKKIKMDSRGDSLTSNDSSVKTFNKIESLNIEPSLGENSMVKTEELSQLVIEDTKKIESEMRFENRPPIYPEEARDLELEGEVILSVESNDEGQITKAQIEKSSGHLILDQAALKSVQNWLIQPVSKLSIPFVFKLK